MRKLDFNKTIQDLNLDYDFSKFDYKDVNTKSIVICCKHGEFLTSLKRLQKGQRCPNCYKVNKVFSKKDFIEKANSIHNSKYDYSISSYTKSTSKIEIICKLHGIFRQFASNHLKGWGCPKCKIEKQKSIFIDNANSIHLNKYDYSIVEYINNKTHIEIICKNHGSFFQRPDNHLQGNGCPNCCSSKGEKIIESFLSNNKINFEPQKKFDECKYKYKLRFDFYLPEYNMCIEFDGIQHHKPIKIFGGFKNLEENINKDTIKDNFCKINNIKLLRINYLQEENIENLISSFLKKIINSDVSTE